MIKGHSAAEFLTCVYILSLSIYLSLSFSLSPPFFRSPGCINRWKSGRSGAAGVRNSEERKAESVRYKEDSSKSWNSSVVNNNKRALVAPTVIFPARKRNENNDEQEGTTIRYGLSGKPGSALGLVRGGANEQLSGSD